MAQGKTRIPPVAKTLCNLLGLKGDKQDKLELEDFWLFVVENHKSPFTGKTHKRIEINVNVEEMRIKVAHDPRTATESRHYAYLVVEPPRARQVTNVDQDDGSATTEVVDQDAEDEEPVEATQDEEPPKKKQKVKKSYPGF